MQTKFHVQKNTEINKKVQNSKEKLADTNNNEELNILGIDIPELSSLNKEGLLKFTEQALSYPDPLKIAKYVSEAKTHFEDIIQNEHDQAMDKFIEDGNNEIDFAPKPDPLKIKFTGIYKQFRKKCNQLKEEIHQNRKDNLEKKLKLIKELKQLTEESENQNSYKKIKQIQSNWRKVGYIPPTEIDNVWNTYNYYINKFYDNLSLHSELKELDRKKNLEAKKELINKALKQLDETNLDKASEQILKIQNEWRYTGPVPKNNSDELQIEFQNVITKFYEKQQLHTEELEAQREKNFKAKIAIIENINQLTELKSETPLEWIEKDKKLTALLELWKEIGLVPSHKVSLIRKQFRDAIKTFKNAKNSFFAEIKKERSNNLKEKRNICNEIESITAKDDFYNYRNEIIELQKKWKKTGPIAKNKLEKIKDYFKKVSDNYFKKLKDYNENQQEVYKENLKLKLAYVEEIEKFIEQNNKVENPEKFIIEAQQKWFDLGFVPIDKKQEINQKFNQVLQKLISTISIKEFNIHPELLKFKVKVKSLVNNNESGKQLVRSEINKLKLQYETKKEEIKSLENNIELFTFKSKDGKKLKADLELKINNIKKSMELIDEKLEIIKQIP